MSDRKVKYDFWMIYNRSPLKPTEDEQKASRFTKYLVELLEGGGEIVGYCPDRDALPGKNVFDLNKEMLDNSRKIIVVVTPELIKNGWQKFCQRCSLKRLIDKNQNERLIPIALGISTEQMIAHHDMDELDWIYFDEDDYRETNDTIQQKWNRIKKAVDPNASIQVSVAECGDNRLRTEHRNLVTQPTVVDFFSDDLIMEVAEKFPSDWKILCIKLGLKDEDAEAIERDHQNSSRMQAYKGLKRTLSSMGPDDKSRLDRLVKVLQNMGRNDIIEKLHAKFCEYQKAEMSSQCKASEGRVVQVVGVEQQWTLTHDEVEQQTLPDDGVDIPDSSMGKDLMSQQSRTSETTVINTVQRSTNLSLNSLSLSMDLGPSVSIPPAQIGKPLPGQSENHPSSQTTTQPPDGTTSKQPCSATESKPKNESSSSVANSEKSSKNSSISTLKGTHQQLKAEEPVIGDGSQQSKAGPTNNDSTQLKTHYANQNSLSNDDDITIDNVEAVFTEQDNVQMTTPATNNSDILDQAEMLNLKSFEDDPVSTDSGVSSFASTPIVEHDNSMANKPQLEDHHGIDTLTETVVEASNTEMPAQPKDEMTAPPSTCTVLNTATNANQTVDEIITPSVDQPWTSSPHTSSSLAENQSTLQGDQRDGIEDLRMASSSSGSQTTNSTGRDEERGDSWISNFGSLVWNVIMGPEFAYY